MISSPKSTLEIDAATQSKPEHKKAKPRKRKKIADPSYRPKKRRCYRPGFKPSTESLLQLMGASTPEAKKVAVQGYHAKSPIKSKTMLLRSPDYQAATPISKEKQVIVTPNRTTKLVTSRVIYIEDQAVSIFLPPEKVKQARLHIPAIPQDVIDTLDIPQGSLEPIIDVVITQADIKRADIAKKRAIEKGVSVRYPQQNAVMRQPARIALQQAAGITIPKRQVHWIHFTSHALLGNLTQTVQNLGIGTKNCNAEMELINPVIKKILESVNHPDKLYLSFYPTWVKGYEKIRLLESLAVEIKDGPNKAYQQRVKFSFDALTLKSICTTEIEIIEDILLKTFKNQPSLSAGKHLLSPNGILSPTPIQKKRPPSPSISPIPFKLPTLDKGKGLFAKRSKLDANLDNDMTFPSVEEKAATTFMPSYKKHEKYKKQLFKDVLLEKQSVLKPKTKKVSKPRK